MALEIRTNTDPQDSPSYIIVDTDTDEVLAIHEDREALEEQLKEYEVEVV